MQFTHALVRPPAASFVDGITTSSLGPPDLPLALTQHDAYCRALETLGLSLIRLPSDPAFPDSTFVEDTAITTNHGAVLTRPGAPSRAGEPAAVGRALARCFPELERIVTPGTVDGGDVCEAGAHFFIGLSARTNADGAAQLAAWLGRHGFTSSTIDIRGFPDLLHLKTGLSWLGDRRVLAAGDLAGHESFPAWEVVRVPEEETYAANCVAVNGAVLVAAGFPKTAALLTTLGHDVLTLEMSEYRKMDGGLSCLSLRW
jgi:dimethylargininase